MAVDFDRQPSQTARPASSAGLLFVKAARQRSSHCTGKEEGKEGGREGGRQGNELDSQPQIRD